MKYIIIISIFISSLLLSYDEIKDLRELKVLSSSKKVENYVLFGSGGHGVNSRAMHYYAVNEHLALFMQFSDGNVLEDRENLKKDINGLIYAIELLFDAIDRASAKGLIPEGCRLLVIDSDFYGKGWDWIQEGQDEIDPATWHEDESLLQALESIQNLA